MSKEAFPFGGQESGERLSYNRSADLFDEMIKEDMSLLAEAKASGDRSWIRSREQVLEKHTAIKEALERGEAQPAIGAITERIKRNLDVLQEGTKNPGLFKGAASHIVMIEELTGYLRELNGVEEISSEQIDSSITLDADLSNVLKRHVKAGRRTFKHKSFLN